MQNISTIYRFNTPFLNIEAEKGSLLIVKDKINDFIKRFETISFNETRTNLGDYLKISLNFDNNFGIIDFYYIKEFKNNYYMPIFKMDIFLGAKVLENQKIIVSFLNNIFECFDGLTEKEYLIDLSNGIYYKNGLFASKIFPIHQFSDLDIIQNQFEKQKGTKLFEEFLTKFSNKNFVLNLSNSGDYHKLHSIILYYIYLVHIMYKNIIDSHKQILKLDNLEFGENEAHKELVKQRLAHVKNLSVVNFNDYYKKLEIFFSLFK